MKSKGFMLIELLVVIVILVILAAVVIPRIPQFMAKAKQGRLEALNNQIQKTGNFTEQLKEEASKLAQEVKQSVAMNKDHLVFQWEETTRYGIVSKYYEPETGACLYMCGNSIAIK